MRIRTVAAGAAVVMTLGLGAFMVAYLQFPTEVRHERATPVAAVEMAETLVALKPPKRVRPVVAVLGANEGSETTDYLIPYGVLKRSGVAEVVSLGTHAGPVRLMPALTIVPEATTAEFDRRYPEGADYVIVPAMQPSSRFVRGRSCWPRPACCTTGARLRIGTRSTRSDPSSRPCITSRTGAMSLTAAW
jgi:hypothetical protein